MREGRLHLGATGIAPWDDWTLEDAPRHKFLKWIRTWKLKRVNESAFVDAVEESLKLYRRMKLLAKESSPKAIRQNLGKAVKASAQLLAQINQLDGNSRLLIRRQMGRRSILKAVMEVHRMLADAHQFAVHRLPLSGRRPDDQRDMLAALLADALERHTSAKLTTTRDKIFENLICEALSLVGETRSDQHSRAERVLKTKLVSRPSPGVVFIDRANRAQIYFDS